jgi:hypothetical protein
MLSLTIPRIPLPSFLPFLFTISRLILSILIRLPLQDLIGLPKDQEPEYTLSHVGALLEAKNHPHGPPKQTEEHEHTKQHEPVGKPVEALRGGEKEKK